MKIWSFIKWKWNKWETWQKWWIVMFFLFGCGLGANSLFAKICLGLSLSIFVYFITKWWIVDPILNSWREFKQERDGLFSVIKDSDGNDH